ncbi:MAG TPA: hypothetical protein VGI29_02250 [Candidatus Binataceae bacterium]
MAELREGSIQMCGYFLEAERFDTFLEKMQGEYDLEERNAAAP